MNQAQDDRVRAFMNEVMNGTRTALDKSLARKDFPALKQQMTDMAAAMVVACTNQITAHRDKLGTCHIACNPLRRGRFFSLNVSISVEFLDQPGSPDTDSTPHARQIVAQPTPPKRRYTLSPEGRAKRIAAVKEYWRKRKAGEWQPR